MPLFADLVAPFRQRATRDSIGSWDTVSYPAITGGSIVLSDGLTATYHQIYRTQPWVFAAVNKIAGSIGRLPLKVYKLNDAGERERVRDSRLGDLLSAPMPFTTPQSMKERWARGPMVFGNAITVKLGMTAPEDEPTELMAAPSIGWRAGEDDTYIWTSNKGEDHVFNRWQIVHFRFLDNDTNGFGTSFLEPLRTTLALEDAARRYGSASFRNGARPGSVLKSDQKIDSDVQLRLKANIESAHGGADNAFKVAILEQGLDWAPWPANLKDATVTEHRELTPKEVAAVFDIPQPAMGILDEANFGSVEALHTMLYQDTLGRWVTMIEETLRTDLIAPCPAYRGLDVKADMNALLRGDAESRFRTYSVRINSGQMTLNESRDLEDLPRSKQPEADLLLVPLNLSGASGALLAEDSGQEDSTNAGA